MAIIKCKECEKEYSNKSINCPSCGCPTIYNDEIKCQECGTYYTTVERECPSCGCPTSFSGKCDEDQFNVYTSSCSGPTVHNGETTAQPVIRQANNSDRNQTMESKRDRLDKILKYKGLIVPIIIVNVVFAFIGTINYATMGLALVILASAGYICGNLYYMISDDKAMSLILGVLSAFGLVGIIPILYIRSKTNTYLNDFLGD